MKLLPGQRSRTIDGAARSCLIQERITIYPCCGFLHSVALKDLKLLQTPHGS